MTATIAVPAAPSDYAVLKRRVQAAGLLERESGFYARSIVCKMTLLAGSLALFVILRSHPWAALPISVGLAIIFGQLGFQLHDAGHRQMFQTRRANVVVGLLTANFLLGISYGWWVDKHNRHHANPNHLDMDPDIGPGVISYSLEQALGSRGFRRFIAKHQAGLFFPLLFGLAWAMHWKSLTFLFHRSHHRWLEVALLALHAVLFLGFLVVVLGPAWALIVVVVQQCCAGFYMASVFAANHKGMPQVSGTVDFLRRQVLTSRNVRSNPLIDVWYGGLNYQIEHHLFPTMSRNRIAAAHSIVRRFCEEQGIAYTETSVLQSYREILSFLHEVGAPVRESQKAGGSPTNGPRAVELIGDEPIRSPRLSTHR